MRVFSLIFLLFLPLFAYKNAFFVGGYNSNQDGKIEASGSSVFDLDGNDQQHKVSSSNKPNGMRFGWHNNSDHTNLHKTKYEFFYEKRYLTYKLQNNKYETTGYHLGFSIAVGYNLDLLTTHEVVPYFKIGAGAGKFNKLGSGTDLMAGVGIGYITRYFELTAGIDREFWQLSGLRFPFSTPFNNNGYIHSYHLGLNIRF